MLLQRFEEQGLSHYSYAVGCPGSGELAIVDPRRDVDIYEDFAAAEKMRIACVLETHIHADFASGARELAQRAGARLLLSAYDKGEVFEVSFPHEELRDGDRIPIGSVRLRAVHTPGHTPEHLSYLVFDGSRSREVPMALLSGDFLFVGSLGRPDLLGEEAKLGLAKQLFQSVRGKLAGLPDGLEIYPAHGAGSMCGAGMSALPHSTLGFERIANPYLDPSLDAAQFVERILGNVPPFPDYYRRMKRLNSEGPAILNGLPECPPLTPAESRNALDAGHAVLDVRDPGLFATSHIPGAFGIGAGKSLSTWASWVAPYETPLLLVADSPAMVESALRSLVRVGLDDVRGHLDGGMAAWTAAGFPTESVGQTSVRELSRALREGQPVAVVDVRTVPEWKEGHIADASHIMGGEIARRLAELPDEDRTLAVICRTGYRSMVAAGVLQRAGIKRVVNVQGGMQAWEAAGLPVAK